MEQSSEREAGGIIPHLTIGGGKAAEAIAFYAKAFGAEESGRHMADDGKRIMHAHLHLNGGHLMLNDEFLEFNSAAVSQPGSFILHLEVPDADAAWNRALEAGAAEHFAIADQFWGARYGQLKDPYGFLWSVASPSIPPQE